LARAADFVRTVKDGTQHTNPPAAVVGDVLAMKTWPGIPALEAVTEVPVLRPDGTVFDTPGYDPETRLVYLPPAGAPIPCVPEAPSPAEIAAACELLVSILWDFPFDTMASAHNALGLLLTPVVRPAIAGTVPLALLDKPKRGTGATLLA